MYDIIIAYCDRLFIKASVNSWIKAANVVGNLLEPIIRLEAEHDITATTIANVHKDRGEKRRRVVNYSLF